MWARCRRDVGEIAAGPRRRRVLQATPAPLAAGGEQQTLALAKRLQSLEQLQLHVQEGEADAARGAAATLLAQVRVRVRVGLRVRVKQP